MYWNQRVYGLASISRHEELNILLKIFPAKWAIIVLGAGIILTAVLWLIKIFSCQGSAARPAIEPPPSRSLKKISILFLLFLGIFLKDNLLHSLQFNHLPLVSWANGTFGNESPLFYFGRSIEYSFFYVFAFIGLFIYRSYHDPEVAFLRSSAFIILIFYIMWSNYQSRYILAAIPFLVVLGVHFWTENFEKAISVENRLVYVLGTGGLTAVMIYTIAKTYAINLLLSYPNNMCYF
jgi:hypothetical protein